MKKILALFAMVVLCATSIFADNYYLKHPWGGSSWEWKQLTQNEGASTYSVTATYGDNGCNWNTSASDDGSTWVGSPTLVGSPAKGDNCTFTLDPTAGTITITKIVVTDPTVYITASAKRVFTNNEVSFSVKTENFDEGATTAITYTKDGGTATSLEGTTFTPTETGSYVFTVTAKGTASGEYKEATATAEVTVVNAKKIYCVNSNNWTTVNVYFWGGASTSTWPGTTMTKESFTKGGYDVYSYSFDATQVIFNDGTNQTKDLTFPTDENDMYDLNAGTWSKYTQEPPSVTLTPSATSVTTGAKVTLTAETSNFSGDPTITYTVSKDDGEATECTSPYTTLAAGTYTFTATAKYGESETATATTTVTAANPKFGYRFDNTDWAEEGMTVVLNNEGTAVDHFTISKDLQATTTYEWGDNTGFKIIVDGAYYGCNANMSVNNHEGWWFDTNSAKDHDMNCGITTWAEGTYKFDVYLLSGYNDGKPIVTVTYPETIEVTLTRTTAANSYGTICLPYNATATNAIVMEMGGKVDNGIQFNYVGETEATSNTLEAGVPYLYRATADEQTFTTTGSTYADATTVNGFAGSYTRTELTAGQYFLYTVDNCWRYAKNADGESETHVFVGAYKCYIPNMDDVNSASARSNSVVFGVETDETTGIQSINFNNATLNNGKYVENGRVVIVKNGKRFNTAGQAVK